MTAMIQVVAGIIFDSDGRFLLARRPRGKVYEGFWEFPGGKVEKNECAAQALVRELEEELGITARKFNLGSKRNFAIHTGRLILSFSRSIIGRER